METHAIQKYQFLHHFLPHPETKKRAKLLQHKALIGYSFGILLLIGAFYFAPKIVPGVLGYASNISVVSLLEETNNVRGQNGLKSLRLNPALTTAAEEKAKHMFENDYWAHVAQDGTTPWDFILEADYDYSYAGENLAKNFNNSDDVVEAWVKSPSHNENLINSNYEEIGFAVVNGVLDGYETTLVVQMFGKPRQASQIASKLDEEHLLESYKQVEVTTKTTIPVRIAKEDLLTAAPQPTTVLPAVDVTTASRTITIAVAGFLTLLLGLDIWYTRRKAIPKISGNAYAHILFLVVAVVGLWFSLIPGEIL
jgi:uncharacterized protein YkwD